MIKVLRMIKNDHTQISMKIENFFKNSQNFGFWPATTRGMNFFGNFSFKLNHNVLKISHPDATVRSLFLYGVSAMRQK